MRPTLSLANLVIIGLAIPICGCTSPTAISPPPPPAEVTPDGPPWFEDVTDRLGIKFTHDPGPTEHYPMYQSIGSGVAACDLDGDGLPDLLFLTNAGPSSKSVNALYRHKADGTFEDVTAGSGLDFAGYNMGVAVGDINNDGKPDLLITQYGGVRLLLNLGNMKFRDVTEEYGLKNPLWGTSAAFVDYDRDGWLDLVVVNYVDYELGIPCHSRSAQLDYCGPNGLRGTATRLFHNVGGKRFEDATVSSHIGSEGVPGLGVAVADFNGDGWPDIFVANDGKPNCLWINQKDGTFKQEAVQRGVAVTGMSKAYAGMGVAIGDADNDGLLDLYVTHYVNETNTLWKQGPRGQFHDATTTAGLTAITHRATGWGTLFGDFDNDGWLDLAIANGAAERLPPGGPRPGVSPFWADYADRNQILRGTGGGKFRDESANSPAFCGYYTVARGLATLDLDGDGGLDLVVNAIGERARVFRNVCPNRGHWVNIRLIDPTLHRDALGAEIVLTSGGTKRLRIVAPADSFLSSSQPIVHFGLGNATSIDSLSVLWPDGKREEFPGQKVDCRLELRKGSGRPAN